MEVAKVAVYQNDGTEKISPARFVERAAAAEDNWSESIDVAIEAVLEGDSSALAVLGAEIAADIGDVCDRVDTGRLKKSFRAEVKN